MSLILFSNLSIWSVQVLKDIYPVTLRSHTLKHLPAWKGPCSSFKRLKNYMVILVGPSAQFWAMNSGMYNGVMGWNGRIQGNHTNGVAWQIAPKNMLRKISQYNSKVPGLTNQWVSIVIETLMIVRMEVVQQHLVDLAMIAVESNA